MGPCRCDDERFGGHEEGFLCSGAPPIGWYRESSSDPGGIVKPSRSVRRRRGRSARPGLEPGVGALPFGGSDDEGRLGGIGSSPFKRPPRLARAQPVACAGGAGGLGSYPHSVAPMAEGWALARGSALGSSQEGPPQLNSVASLVNMAMLVRKESTATIESVKRRSIESFSGAADHGVRLCSLAAACKWAELQKEVVRRYSPFFKHYFFHGLQSEHTLLLCFTRIPRLTRSATFRACRSFGSWCWWSSAHWP